MFKNVWSCSNVRSFFQPLDQERLWENWSCFHVQKSLVGLVTMFDPFSSRLIAISSVFSPFVPHFSERHARPIEKTNKPKIFKHFAKDFFINTQNSLFQVFIRKKVLRQILLYLVCEVRMIWHDVHRIVLVWRTKQNFRFSEQRFALDLLYFECEVRWPGVNDVKASSSWRTLDLIPIKDQWSHLEDTRSNTNGLYQRINVSHHQIILHQNHLLDTAEDEKIRLGLLDFDSCKTQLLIKYFTDYWQRSTT